MQRGVAAHDGRCREYNSDGARQQERKESVPCERGGRSSNLTTGIDSTSGASNPTGAARSSIR